MKFPLMALLALCWAPSLEAAEHPVFEVSGHIADEAGWPLSGLYLLNFELRTDGPDGLTLWSERQYIRAKDGVYRTWLGKLTPLPGGSGTKLYIAASSPGPNFWHLSDFKLLSVAGSKTHHVEAVPGSATVKNDLKPKTPSPASPPKKPEPVLEEGLEPTAEDIPATPGDPPGPLRYEVEPGDTLPSISKKVYGTRSRWKEIYEANKQDLDPGGMVRPGQSLIIP